MPRPHVSDVALDLSVNSSRKSPTERNAQRMPDQYCFYNAPTSSQSLERFNARIRSLYAMELSESAYLPKTDSHYVSLPLRTFRLESGDDDPQLRNILKADKMERPFLVGLSNSSAVALMTNELGKLQGQSTHSCICKHAPIKTAACSSTASLHTSMKKSISDVTSKKRLWNRKSAGKYRHRKRLMEETKKREHEDLLKVCDQLKMEQILLMQGLKQGLKRMESKLKGLTPETKSDSLVY